VSKQSGTLYQAREEDALRVWRYTTSKQSGPAAPQDRNQVLSPCELMVRDALSGTR
jgi:hypothetical protein